MASEVVRVAGGLSDLGADPGGHVVLIMANSPEFHVLEAIRSIVIVDDAWLPGTPLFTPANKPRREAVLAPYVDRLTGAYAEADHRAARI